MQQTVIASIGYEKQKWRTRGEWILEEMDRMVPWARSRGVMESHGRTGDDSMFSKRVHGEEEAEYEGEAHGGDEQWEKMGWPKLAWEFMRKAPKGARLICTHRRFD